MMQVRRRRSKWKQDWLATLATATLATLLWAALDTVVVRMVGEQRMDYLLAFIAIVCGFRFGQGYERDRDD